MNALASPAGVLQADLDAGPRRAALWLTGVLAAFLAVGVGWMAWAQLDVSVQARGAVVAPSRVQELQSLEGGIVRELLVQPGQAVRRGQPLVRLDRAQYDAERGESRLTLLGLSAARTRADALLAGAPPRFDPALEREAPELVREERRLWQEAREEALRAQQAAQEAVHRQEAELAETRTRIDALQQSLRVTEESHAIEDRLFREGAGSRADYLTAQQRLVSQRGELDTLRQAVPRLNAALAEARAQAGATLARYRAQWSTQRAELESRAAVMGQTLKGREERLERRELVSPMDGIVNRVLIPTRNGVAAPGAPILEIVPDDGGMSVTARVKPADIGFLHAGQKAVLRVLPFDDAVYGKLPAVVERVGADTLLDENKQPYYEVQLRTERAQLEHHGQRLALQPGMPVDASILTAKRSVLQYLLKPVLKTLDAALQER
ncbi:HlyD family type I secretion periplasmic adaptor subunit [Aquabacterium sp. J223]|uniref:HlyD family type I secretion periplasmic adaptor subunit n=1 Tax=Aquabacterium sp. J223 TaxID=2898431 RepID=UPI0021AD877A|nr:HlyD family type I secretion periplasmic adaptor subunit [Aquabacterium sp. J223]UUX95085.1 HlyD family type I secretion periplasmic adaptor subunit [Aquabacterium sp. J223]